MTRADWSQFKRACEDSFKNGENSVDDDVDIMYEDMVQKIISAAEKCIPRTRPKCRQKRLPYWNKNCRDAVYARNRARNKMNKNRTQENVEAYRKLKGVAQKTMKDAACFHWRDFCSTLLKKMNGLYTSNKPQHLVCEGSKIESDEEKANLFADNFVNVSSSENYSSGFKMHRFLAEKQGERNLPSENSESSDIDNSLNDRFSYHELKRAIKESKRNSSPGEDKITYDMLQHLPRRALQRLLFLYNSAWQKGCIPQAWKHSIIIPVLKMGKNKEDISSYRPISLTNTIGKIMEKLVANRLRHYLETNSLLTNVQTGFRKGRGTVDHLIRLQDTINKYNLNRGYTVAVFIDFKSAYDMLSHDVLKGKLKKLGLTGEIYQYIDNFLTGRTIQVQVGNKFSKVLDINNGTPQGSVISPLLLLIMINDLHLG